MKYFILLLLLLPTLTLAEDKKCEAVMTASPAWSSFNFSRYFPFQSQLFRSQAVRPKEGVGQLLVVELGKEAQSSKLKLMIEHFPEYFKQFDMSKNNSKFIIPDAERLNSLMKNGVQFYDIPFYRRQRYSDAFFNEKFQQGYIPLASLRYEFYHDRFAEHLLAALVMPPWLYQKIRTRYEMEQEFFSAANMLDYPALARFRQYYYYHFQTIGALWDSATSTLGGTIALATYRDSETILTPTAVSQLKWVLHSLGKRFSTGSDSELLHALLHPNLWNGSIEEKRQLYQLLQKVLKPDSKVTEQFAKDEAVRILHEVTGYSVDMIKKIPEPR